MAQQSSIPRGAVNAATRFKSATRATMSTVTSGTGRHLPLSFFGAKQFSYGVRAKIWGRAQTFRSAFVVKRYGGGVFKRTGNPRNNTAAIDAVKPCYDVACIRMDKKRWNSTSRPCLRQAWKTSLLRLSGMP